VVGGEGGGGALPPSVATYAVSGLLVGGVVSLLAVVGSGGRCGWALGVGGGWGPWFG
jgi:hypothetical protein